MTQEPSDFERFLGPDRRTLPRLRGLGVVVAIIAVVMVVGLVSLRPGAIPTLDLAVFGFADDVIPATVESVVTRPCSYAADLNCREVSFLVAPREGVPEEALDGHLQEFPDEAGQPEFAAGDAVYLSLVGNTDGTSSLTYYDRDRGPVLALTALAFGLAVVGLGRLRGLAALVGLAISIAVLVAFIVPAIIAGRDAVLVAVVGGGTIALVSLYLAHGYKPLTHVAAVGAFSALALTSFMSWAVVEAAQLSGLASEESFYLLALPGIDLTGLVLAGVVLGSIGALDDVTVTQSSAVWEVSRANPELSRHDLFQAGLRIGRDHIASTVNTLLLAYAGAALPLLILYSLSALPLSVVASSEVVTVEIVRTLVGSIGLVASVPITTWLAARQRAVRTG